MKKYLSGRLAAFWMGVLLVLTQTVAFAQERALDVNVDVNKGGGSAWYATPWVWIVGAAVFILLLAAILRGGDRRSDA